MHFLSFKWELAGWNLVQNRSKPGSQFLICNDVYLQIHPGWIFNGRIKVPGHLTAIAILEAALGQFDHGIVV